MNKTIITGASAVLAVLPMASAFAATGTTVTDTVQVTINTACNITSTNAANTYSATMTNGQLKSDFGSTSMSISCNDAAGWKLNAVGTGADATTKTAMNATGSGTDIATGTATTGNTSNWAMKLAGSAVVEAYKSFIAIPSGSTKVAGTNGAVSGSTVTTTYQVFISPTQQADTYTGQVTYTLVHPATAS